MKKRTKKKGGYEVLAKKFPGDNPEILAEIELLSSRGLRQIHIYGYYGISADLWYRAVRRYPEMAQAYKRGKSKGVNVVAAKMMKLIEENENTEMIKFYLRSVGHFKDPGNLQIVNEKRAEARKDLKITETDPIEASRAYQRIMTGVK